MWHCDPGLEAQVALPTLRLHLLRDGLALLRRQRLDLRGIDVLDL